MPHVALGRHADLVVVAPATADLLARAAHGLADDLLTNTLLTARCPVLFAPAMHTEMWEHPATVDNVATLRRHGSVVLEPGDAPPVPAPAQRDADGRQQRALRRALGELMQRFGDLTGQVPPSLGEADTAMRDAAQALQDGRDDFAGAAQQRAIEALQKGGREMGQTMARQFGVGEQPGEGEGGEGEGDGEPGMADGNQPGNRPGDPTRPGTDGRNLPSRRQTRRDPLGRELPQGAAGSESSEGVRVPDQMEEARTRAIQEELRRRGADRSRPQPELDYIDRLLKTY